MIKLALKIGISVVLVTFLAFHVDFSSVWDLLRSLNPVDVLIVVFIQNIAWAIGAYRLYFFLHAVPYRVVLQSTYSGNFYALFLPGQLAGEAVKALRIARYSRRYENTIGVLILDKILGMLGVFILIGAGLLLSESAFLDSKRAAGIALAVTFLFVLLVVILTFIAVPGNFIFTGRILRKAWIRWPVFKKPLRFAMKLLVSYREAILHPLRVSVSFFLAIVYQILAYSMALYMSRALGLDIGVFDLMWVYGFVSIAVLLPVSIAGIGVREASYVGFLGLLGMEKSAGFGLSIAIFGIFVISSLIGGVVDFFSFKIKKQV